MAPALFFSAMLYTHLNEFLGLCVVFTEEEKNTLARSSVLFTLRSPLRGSLRYGKARRTSSTIFSSTLYYPFLP